MVKPSPAVGWTRRSIQEGEAERSYSRCQNSCCGAGETAAGGMGMLGVGMLRGNGGVQGLGCSCGQNKPLWPKPSRLGPGAVRSVSRRNYFPR